MNGINELLNIKFPIVLASRSPRRKHLMEMLGFDFKIIAADIEEIIDPELPPEAIAIDFALSKARAIAEKLKDRSIVIGADTIVIVDDEIISKPANKNEAFEMLKKLSGRSHFVMTGIAIVDSHSINTVTTYKVTEVTFRKLSDQEINKYIESGSPMDKAGAYGIQDDFGAVFVRSIDGCYYNVVGLPVEELYQKLQEFADATKN